MRRPLIALTLVLLVAASCGSSADDDAGADDEVAGDGAANAVAAVDEEPTEVPEPTPTAVPEPMAVPTATPQPTPDTPCGGVETGTSTFTLEAGGAVHDVQIYVPSRFDPATPPPLVLNWHGLGSNGSEQALFTGYENLAEAERFVVVHPTGVPAAGDTRNSWELPQFDTPERDDVAFANALLDLLISDYCVDATRVYSTGMSNGGLFTSVLVCEMADRLAAAASVAGTTHDDSCRPSRAVPYLSFHGTADTVVPFDGTQTTSVLGADNDLAGDFFSQVMPQEFAEFAADMGCGAEPAVSQYSGDVTAYSYTGCNDDAPLIFYEIADGGHTWPDTPIAAALGDRLGYTTLEIDATADAWAFFQQHALPID